MQPVKKELPEKHLKITIIEVDPFHEKKYEFNIHKRKILGELHITPTL